MSRFPPRRPACLRLLLTAGAFGCGGTGPNPPPPPPPAVASLALEPQDTTVEVEDTFSLRATAKSAAGQVIPGVTITFAAQPADVIDVGSGGQVVGAQTGVATVTARAGAITGNATVHVRTKVLLFDFPAQRTFAEVYGVDDAGTVVGALYGTGIPEPFISGPAPQLLLLPALTANLAGQARGVNATGTIVGYSLAPDQQSLRLVTWTKDRTIADLGQLGVTRSIGVGVTTGGAILVNVDRNSATRLIDGGSVRATNGSATAIPALPGGDGYFHPTAIASSGVVVGISHDAQGATMPAIWRPTTGNTEALAGMSAGAYPASVATGDRVVGFTDAADPRAFLQSPSGVRLLGALGGVRSIAWGINDLGTVVGE